MPICLLADPAGTGKAQEHQNTSGTQPLGTIHLIAHGVVVAADRERRIRSWFAGWVARKGLAVINNGLGLNPKWIAEVTPILDPSLGNELHQFYPNLNIQDSSA